MTRGGQLCTLDDAGERVDEGRVRSTPTALRARFAALPPATRVALETGTHSLWVSELLAELGREVIVANARELRAITASVRKSDKADAEKRARYARVDPAILCPLRHRTAAQQADWALVRARAVLVRMRPLAINAVRGRVKPLGHRLPSCAAAYFAPRCRALLPEALAPALGPVLDPIESLSARIAAYDEQGEARAARAYPAAAPLRTVPGVGPITALTFVLTVADPARFAASRDGGCYLGLRPKQRQSGERDPQLGISKAGDSYLRSLRVECAQPVLRERGADSALRQWGLRLAARGGANAKKRAVVAVARQLAVLLHRLWARQEAFVAFPVGRAATG